MQHLFSFIGATEIGWYHCIEGGNENWSALKFVSGIGYHFEEVSDGMFELLIVSDSKTDKFHGIFETFPELQEYRTRDLYSPMGSGWWQYKGRADDLIVLSNGEKINPIPLENKICSHTKIKAALVVGEYRFSPSLLVELEDKVIPRTPQERRDLLNDIWPVVQEANRSAPAFSKIPKSLVLLTTAEKPFARAGKGTVQRQKTVKLFSQELDQLFSSQETSLLTEGLSLVKPISPSIVKTFTRELYLQTLQMKEAKNVSEVDDSDNVFEKGLDSLGVMVIVQRLKAALKFCEANIDLNVIDPRLVYSAPSIGQISNAIITILENGNEASTGDGSSVMVPRQRKMEEILQKYSKGIPSRPFNDEILNGLKIGIFSRQKGWRVILTGTTGSLGSYLLAAIEALPESQVAKIFCLNRSPNSEERQKKSNLSRGLDDSWLDGRVEFLQADLSLEQLGLARETYLQLIDEATVIIHCAWKVDFNLTLESFEPQIRGVRNLLDFSFLSKNKAPVVFISTISTALGWGAKTPGSAVPEAIIHDFEAPERIGYGESKYICELLIENFGKTSGISTAIFRTGQIAGPLSKKGLWNKQEWFPSIIASSKHLNTLPETLGTFEKIDWVPVDLLSTIMVELVEKLISKDKVGTEETLVYNLVNPKVTTWSSLLPAVQELAGTPRTLPLGDWVKELEKSANENFGIVTERNPGLKLLDFFRSLSSQEISSNHSPQFEVTKLVHDSRHASRLDPVSPKWMGMWMDQWKF
jgi:thioester reductase-like protein